MSTTSAARGVCAACKYDPSCIYEADSGRAIWQCEQFELGLRPSTPGNGRAPAISFETASPDLRQLSNHLGLCSNCDNRETCIYPKPEGGIWRCEEYV
ncbi:MAG: hypothetical protein ABSG26_20825 [Bryobacteraceae bacterium]|jgi:hypothetical protein